MYYYNDDFKFPIVRKERKLFFRILRATLIVCSLLFFIGCAIFGNHILGPNYYLLGQFLGYCGLPILPIGVFLMFYSALVKNFVIIGNSIITKESIIIDIKGSKESYSLKDVLHLKITFTGGEGDSI